MKHQLLACCVLVMGEYTSFETTHPELYAFGESYVEQVYEEAEAICSKFGYETDQVLAIAFPEVCRYSDWRDAAESTALHYFYVNLGEQGADFSIGHFQMKPSFIERMEEQVIAQPSLSKLRFICPSAETSVTVQRSQRLERLQDSQWQLAYLCAFYTIMEERFGSKDFEDEAAKVAFYAAAYNRGFWHNENEITQWQQVRSFPSGEVDAADSFSYAAIARDFYLKN